MFLRIDKSNTQYIRGKSISLACRVCYLFVLSSLALAFCYFLKELIGMILIARVTIYIAPVMPVVMRCADFSSTDGTHHPYHITHRRPRFLTSMDTAKSPPPNALFYGNNWPCQTQNHNETLCCRHIDTSRYRLSGMGISPPSPTSLSIPIAAKYNTHPPPAQPRLKYHPSLTLAFCLLPSQ